jgi:hyaluronate lyase
MNITCRNISLKCLLLLFFLSIAKLSSADPYDEVRSRWCTLLTGTSMMESDPYIKTKVENLTQAANVYWQSFDKSASRTILWKDLNYALSSHISASYARLNVMALAYCTKSSALYHNEELKADILTAMDWLSDKKYNTSIPLPDGSQPRQINNWWDYKIGTPLSLNNVVVLMYDELGKTRREKYMSAVAHFLPNLTDNGFTNGQVMEFTAANRVWICTILALKAVILKDEKQLDYARNELNPIFTNVTTGDGFYEDGSFVQHDGTPYTGGYGLSLIDNLSRIMYMLDKSPWPISASHSQHIYSWIQDAFKPIVSASGIMGMVTGREISRGRGLDLGTRRLFDPVLLLSEIAKPEEALRLQQLLKTWLSTYATLDYKSFLGIFSYELASRILSNTAIPTQPAFFYKQFPNMDRTVMHRPKYSFGISMYSSRTYNYESINTENLKGWHTGDGMTYLYNGDITQFEDSYWPTVNFYQLPGTTVEEHTMLPPSQFSKQAWVGGTSMNNLYGVTGMYLAPQGQTLEAKKSWFMFDNEIACLGAGIINNDQKNVQTFIEQRKLDANNGNRFTVDGQLLNVDDAKAQSLSKTVKWAHLSGTFKNSDIGYYFPEKSTIQIARKKQSGYWKDINNMVIADTIFKENYFLTLWQDHGNHAIDSGQLANKYAYVLLPGSSETEVAQYSKRPDLLILENSARVQAVKEQKLNIVAANFWENEKTIVRNVNGKTYLTCSQKASIMVKETPVEISLSIADPTMLNSDIIELSLNAKGAKLISADPGITIQTTGSAIKVIAKVKGLMGKSLHARLSKTQP